MLNLLFTYCMVTPEIAKQPHPTPRVETAIIKASFIREITDFEKKLTPTPPITFTPTPTAGQSGATVIVNVEQKQEADASPVVVPAAPADTGRAKIDN